ncbi:PREDICTED: fibulin-1-like [Priapulus caudatus]|uniref:Fibulin-1-like n=1 Tax=Priapulus caudatus TaxID=37621 RepID=A0ABM1EHU1_PRICU|nr:PREDICTED: fibulin-1-like [Priapulus caudatus]
MSYLHVHVTTLRHPCCRVDDGYLCHKTCEVRDTACSGNLTHTITYQWIHLPSIAVLPAPIVITNMQALVRSGMQAVQVTYEILIADQSDLFDVRQSGHTGGLRLLRPIQGPYSDTVHLQMTVRSPFGNVLSVHLAYIVIDVSANLF